MDQGKNQGEREIIPSPLPDTKVKEWLSLALTTRDRQGDERERVFNWAVVMQLCEEVLSLRKQVS